MSSRTATSLCLLLVLLLFGSVFSTFALDWEEFAASSTSSQDTVLLDAMNAHDLDTDLAICRGVARRTGADVGGFLDSLAERSFGAGAARTELLLRVLLETLAPESLSGAQIVSRTAPITGSLEALLRRMPEWRDAQLAAALTRLSLYADPKVALPALMSVGTRVVQGLRSGQGRIPPQEVSLAIAFCDTVETAHSIDFLEPCIQITNLSQDGRLIERARRAARSLSSP
jgi:hypothetical protein